ncbi:T9SS type A sorting domain-containing protein [Aureispira sp. CCB-QB1]|uniref:T9SS type A sorting domain-containing protein n=1 Tax=Aureispira sp. CCB-QB1 TaxID=1313421 RepID=UPI0006988A8A|nr:T9SS type A sorting domain-containing protein [Aureispira sp. CCB-QB1]
MKQYFSFLAGFILCVQASVLKAQNVHIPDQTFKNYLITGGVDTNQDFEIQISEAQNFTGLININGLAISDLTGLEEFTKLTRLYCEVTNITSLDVSANVMLTELHCGNNDLTSLDLSNNVNLTNLKCYVLKITELDLSNNVNLVEVDCRQDSLLTRINIKNGNNTAITSFLANDNPALTCIEVDSVAYSTANWTNIDAGVVFSTSCFTGINTVGQLPSFRAYPNPTTKTLTVDMGETILSAKITVLNTIGQIVSSENYKNIASLDLNIQGLPGWYFIQIETEKGNQTIKVLKQG